MSAKRKITPPALADGMTDSIILRGLSLKCIIGIDAAEKCVRQLLLLDVVLNPDKAAAADTPAVDYHAVVCCLHNLAAQSRHGLMEDFAEEAATVLLREFNISRVRVYCRKPKPLAGLAEAGVEIIRERGSNQNKT